MQQLIPNYTLPIESTLKSADQEISHEFMETIDGVDVLSVIRKDKKYVTLVSSFTGIHQFRESEDMIER